MSAYHFGCGRGHLSNAEADRRRRIASRHGCVFTRIRQQGERGQYRWWFSKRNQGHPFDGGIARAVLAEVEAGA